jgi:hypothetical protein
VRPGGFFRVEALSGKEEDATYVDSNGVAIPDDEVEKYKGQNEEKSQNAEEVSRRMATGSALSPAAPLRAPTNQQPVVGENAADANVAQTTDAPPDTAGGTRGSL